MDAVEVEDVRPCRMHAGDGGIYYTDHNGKFWDEVSHKDLDDEELRKARFEEIKQFYSYEVYKKVPVQECWIATGKTPIQVKWVDINTGDAVRKEYRSRPVAKEIKLAKRKDLFAATPPLEAKKMLLSYAVRAGIGYVPGDEE